MKKYLEPWLIITSLAFFSTISHSAKSQAIDSIRFYKLIDSLKSEIKTTNRDTIQYQLLYNIAYEFFDVDNKEAVKYAQRSHDLSFNLADSFRIVRSGRQLAQLLRRVDKLDESIDKLTEILSIAKRNNYNSEVKRILNALAVAYNYKANFSESLKYNFECLAIREKENNKYEISMSLNNIGLTYYKLNNCNQALDFYKRSVYAREHLSPKELEQAKKDVNDIDGLMETYINIALCYLVSDELEMAYNSVNKAISICKGDCSVKMKMTCESSLGQINKKRKMYKEAISNFQKSNYLAEKFFDKRYQAENHHAIGIIFMEMKNYKGAIAEFNISVKIAKEGGYTQIEMNNYSKLKALYAISGDSIQYRLYRSKYDLLQDSIFNQQLITDVTELQNIYQETENYRKISTNFEGIHELESKNAESKTHFIIMLIIIISFLTLTAIFIKFNFYSKQ